MLDFFEGQECEQEGPQAAEVKKVAERTPLVTRRSEGIREGCEQIGGLYGRGAEVPDGTEVAVLHPGTP